jgi:hypothetical protein
MNNEKASQQSSPVAEPREQLKTLLSYVEERAEDVLRQYGRLHPALYAVSPEGLCLHVARSLEDSEKDAFANDVRLICRAHGATVAALVTEAWVVFAKPGDDLGLQPRPAQSPQRREYVSLIGETLGGAFENRLLPIRRDRHGRFSGLGRSQTLPLRPVVGRFSNLLQQTTPTEADRALARVMLQGRGIVIDKESPKG